MIRMMRSLGLIKASWRRFKLSRRWRGWVRAGGTLLSLLSKLVPVLTAAAVAFSGYAIWQTNEQLKLTEQGQITARYSDAVSNLGSTDPDARMGGIIALQRLMQDSPDDQPAIVQILASYVRHRAKPSAVRKLRNAPAVVPRIENPKIEPPADVQAALTALSVRPSSESRQKPLDLSRLNLDGANLNGIDLEHADLHFSTFRYASFVHANLAYASLFQADFSDATMTGTDLRKVDATLSVFNGARLSNAKFDAASVTESYLSGADLRGATLTGTSLLDTSVENSALDNASLVGADLTGTTFDHSTLTGADMSRTLLCDGKRPVFAKRKYRCHQ